MRTIIEGIAHGDLIIAELTGNNPNVFYELGVSHGIQKSVIMICQDLDQVPFDLRSYNVILYSTDLFEVEDFKSSLRSLARGKKDGSVSFENPVSDFAPGAMVPMNSPHRTSMLTESGNDPVARDFDEELVGEDKGILDFSSGAETAMMEIGEIATSLTEHMNKFGVGIAGRSAEADVINQSTAPGSAARMLRLANEMATDMGGFSDNADAELPAFRKAWENFENDFTNIISNVRVESEEDQEAAEGLLSLFDELRDGLNQALTGIDQGRGQFESLRGISAKLNMAVRRLEKTMDSMYEEFSTGESIIIRTRNLLDQKLRDS